MQRRTPLVVLSLIALLPGLGLAQNPPKPGASVVDSVALNVLATDGVAEQAAAQVARALSQGTGLWVKATVWVSPGPLEPLPGRNQSAGEDSLARGRAPISSC